MDVAAHALLAAWPEARERTEALAGALVALIGAAREGYPEVALDDGSFVRFVAERVPRSGDVAVAVGAVAAADLLLVAACVAREPAAVARFESTYLARVPAYLHRMGSGGPGADEVKEVLREKLFIGGANGRAALLDYQGRGSLDGWVRLAAVRHALNLRRGDARHDNMLERAGAEPVPTPNPELEILRTRYRVDFEGCFREALAALPSEDRAVLRLRYMDGLGVGQIATLRGVHRSTVTRWLSTVQATVFGETLRLLKGRLGSTNTELESLVGLLHSRADFTLHDLFAATQGARTKGPV